MSPPSRLARRVTAASAALALLVLLGPTVEGRGNARDRWQRPADVMDVLGLGKGAAVADVGTGDGYFAFHLARRVGGDGRVLAVDIAPDVVATLKREAGRRRLSQLQAVLGAVDDPKLPAGTLDAILVVNSYHEMDAHDAMMAAFAAALKPGGRLGIIDKETPAGEPRAAYASRHVLPASLVREDATRHGLHFLRQAPGFVRPRDGGEAWYFLVFERERAPAP